MSEEMFLARSIVILTRGWAAKARREGRNEWGASAIEWAIISAVVVILALGIAKAIQTVVTNNENKINQGTNTGG